MAKSTKAKAEKKTAKSETPEVKNNFVQINDFDGVITEAMHIRNVGVVSRDRTANGGVTSVFIPGAKIKTKKGQKFIVIDKGPKPKKDKA